MNPIEILFGLIMFSLISVGAGTLIEWGIGAEPTIWPYVPTLILMAMIGYIAARLVLEIVVGVYFEHLSQARRYIDACNEMSNLARLKILNSPELLRGHFKPGVTITVSIDLTDCHFRLSEREHSPETLVEISGDEKKDWCKDYARCFSVYLNPLQMIVLRLHRVNLTLPPLSNHQLLKTISNI